MYMVHKMKAGNEMYEFMLYMYLKTTLFIFAQILKWVISNINNINKLSVLNMYTSEIMIDFSQHV